MTAILAALFGASAAGYISHVLTRRRDRLKEEREAQRAMELERRERVGLLKLVHSEITNNLEHLKRMGGDRNEEVFKIAALKSDAWEQSRTKLAELVEEQDFEYLVSCYWSLSFLKDRLLHPERDALTGEEHVAQVKSVSRHHWLAFEVCRVQTKRFR